MSKRTFVLMLFVCSLALPALAVEKGQIGLALSTGSPSTLGALWHVSNRVALDPTVGFSVRSTDDFCTDGDFCGPTPGPEHTLYGGLGLRYYVAPGRTVSPYLRTRLSYSLTSGDGHTLTWTVAAAGLHYSPSKHFSVFGDVGLSAAGSWQHLSEVNDGQVSVGHSRTWTVGTFTSSIGAVLYLN